MIFKILSNPGHSVIPPQHTTAHRALASPDEPAALVAELSQGRGTLPSAALSLSIPSPFPCSLPGAGTTAPGPPPFPRRGCGRESSPLPCPLPPRRGLQPVSSRSPGTQPNPAQPLPGGPAADKGCGPGEPGRPGTSWPPTPPAPQREAPPRSPAGVAAALTLRVGQGDHGGGGSGTGTGTSGSGTGGGHVFRKHAPRRMRGARPLALLATNQQPSCIAARVRFPVHGPRPALIGGEEALAPGPARQWLRVGDGRGGAGARRRWERGHGAGAVRAEGDGLGDKG